MKPELLQRAKSLGFSDRQIAEVRGITEDVVREVALPLDLERMV